MTRFETFKTSKPKQTFIKALERKAWDKVIAIWHDGLPSLSPLKDTNTPQNTHKQNIKPSHLSKFIGLQHPVFELLRTLTKESSSLNDEHRQSLHDLLYHTFNLWPMDWFKAHLHDDWAREDFISFERDALVGNLTKRMPRSYGLWSDFWQSGPLSWFAGIQDQTLRQMLFASWTPAHYEDVLCASDIKHLHRTILFFIGLPFMAFSDKD